MKVKSETEVAQSCATLSDPMDSSLPGSSVHGIFQARVLEWVAIAFSEFQFRKKKKILEMSGDGCSTMNILNTTDLYTLKLRIYKKFKFKYKTNAYRSTSNPIGI